MMPRRPVVIINFFDLGTAIGARSLCAYLIQNGFPAKLIHFGMTSTFANKPALRLLQCRGFLNISEVEPPPDSLYDKCLDTISELNPLLVGLSVDSRMTPFARKMTEKLAAGFPDLPLVWGGIHAITDPEHCLQFSRTVCTGEGEVALVEMAQRIESGNLDFRGIKNLRGVTPDGTEFKEPMEFLSDLDALAPPWLDPKNHIWFPEGSHDRMTNLERIEGGHYFRVWSTMAARGCLFRCAY